MAFSNQRLRTLRQSVWGSGTPSAQQIGEAVRDLATALIELSDATFFRSRSFINTSWSTPFYVSYDHQPVAVLLATARVAQQPTTVSNGTVSWVWTGTQIRIDDIAGLVIGDIYDLVFLVFG